ncbi:MAG: PLP-dependent aminotransferase family protein [Euzebyales bacterium]|jgi:DNA-binding transcriptional MocR family regulator|nr:PLP-dependent aminotransferase family protein [Euzebyales bacterium]
MLISFARGAPSADLLPVAAVRDAAERVLASDAHRVLSYGPSGGYPALRDQLAARHRVPPDRIIVTNGSLQGVAFVAELLARQRRAHVAVEAPTYDRSLLNFRDRGYRIDAVPLEADGLDVDTLAALAPPALLYVIPTFQNPAGCTLSAAKRERVVAWAEEREVLVFEDDPYSLLRYAGTDVATLRASAPERVIWSTSFTKTVAPGLRVGYLIVPDSLAGELSQLATNTYISPSFLPQAICADLLERGTFEVGVAAAREALAARLAALCDALDLHLPDASYVRPEGGYFLWLRLPAGVDAATLGAAAARRDVTFVPGTDFFVPTGDGATPGRDAIRLAFSAATPEQIAEGVERLAAAVADAAG